MADKEMIGVRAETDLRKDIEDQLEWGDTLTEWCLDAFEMKLFIDQLADAQSGELPDQWWEDAIEQYIQEQESTEVDEGNQTQTAQAAD